MTISSLLEYPEVARQIMEEHLLPLIGAFVLTANMVPVRTQYAVVLAYYGESESAWEEMARLQPFAGALTPDKGNRSSSRESVKVKS